MHKLKSGIPGFDALSAGGLPAGRVTLLRGEPGSGKTVFALQHLVAGAVDGEAGLLLSFEEREGNLRDSCTAFGWPAALFGATDSPIRILDARPHLNAALTGAFDLSGVLAAAGHAVAGGARRLVFDGLDGLLQMLGDPAAERAEFARLYGWIEAHDASCLITSRRAGANASPASRDRAQMLEFLSDCVIDLWNHAEGLATLRELRIAKYRGSGHASEHHPLLIGGDGMRIGRQAESALDYPAGTERIGSGLERLDTLLGGGVLRGTCVLLSGAPGTAKTTLACAFVAAACARGERALMISFDESPAQIVRNLRSVGIDLQPHRDSGLLRMDAQRAHHLGGEALFEHVRRQVEDHAPGLVVIDPLNALTQLEGRYHSDLVRRVLDLLKQRGITALVSSLVADADHERTPLHVSTVADTWLHLNFAVAGGERNRALTIVKSRGSAHSNQVRELVLDRSGLSLTDVYTAGGEVLMGTARLEKEREQVRAAADRHLATRMRLREVEIEQAGARAELEALNARIERLVERRRQLAEREIEADRDDARARSEIASARRGDTGAPR